MESEDVLLDYFRAKVRYRFIRLRIIRAIEFLAAGTIVWNLGSLLVHH